MRFIREHATYANVMATLAFMLALTGGAYAVTVPRNSVGTKQIRRAAVTNVKVKKGSLGIDRFSKQAQQSLKVAGPKGDAGAAGAPGMVRAYGRIVNGLLDTTHDHKGIVSSRMGGSYACVKLDSSINAATATPIVVNNWPSGWNFSVPVSFGASQPTMDGTGTCDQPNEVRAASISVRTNADLYGIGPGDFTIAVP